MPETVSVLARARAANPKNVAFACVDMAELGVPQRRKRLIAAPPQLLAALLRKLSASRVRSVRDVIANPRGSHIHQGGCCSRKRRVRTQRQPGQSKFIYVKESSEQRWFHNSRPVTMTAHTVRSRHALSWVKVADGKVVSHSVLLPSEISALQTFPPDYKLPVQKVEAYIQLGNAVPPLVSRLLLEDVA